MNKSLAQTINEHTERVIRMAFTEGAGYGLELAKQILNSTPVNDEKQANDREELINKLVDKYKVEETNEE